jgi:cysteine-rich repeat protein
LLSLFLVGAVGSAFATVEVQFYDPSGNLIVGTGLDMLIFNEQGKPVGKATLPADPDGTFSVPLNLGQKALFLPVDVSPQGTAYQKISVQVPNVLTGPLPVIVPLGGAPNDDCTSPEDVGALPASVSSTTVGALDTNAPFCGTSDDTAGDVWYSFSGTGTRVLVSLCPANGGTASYDSKLGVYCDDCATCIDGNDDSCGLQSEIEVDTALGQTYHIQVHGFAGNTGTFTLTVSDTGNPNVDTPVVCPIVEDIGACCNCLQSQPENCTIETESQCANIGGLFQGNLSACLTPTGITEHFHQEPALAIPDNVPAGVSDTINIASSILITDVNINLGINHTWQSDLFIDVEHNNTVVRLWSRANVCGSQNNINATADDSGTVAVVGASCTTPIGTGPIHDVLYPTTGFGLGDALALFNGTNAQGDWTLTVSDNFGIDFGTVNFWGVDIIGGTPVCAVCGDGAIDAGEECDDGNQTPFDGCTQCNLDPPPCPVCGNGVLESGEQCDPPAAGTCDAECNTIDPPCATCGNGVVDAGEECDDGNQTANDGCTNCTIDPPPDDHGHDDHGHDDHGDDNSSDDNNSNNSTSGCNSCGINHFGPHTGQVTMCHNAGSQWWWNRETINILPSSVPGHCAHNDTCGSCGNWWHSIDPVGAIEQQNNGPLHFSTGTPTAGDPAVPQATAPRGVRTH